VIWKQRPPRGRPSALTVGSPPSEHTSTTVSRRTLTTHDPPERGETPAAAVLDGFFVRVQSWVSGLDGIAAAHDGETYRPVPAEQGG